MNQRTRRELDIRPYAPLGALPAGTIAHVFRVRRYVRTERDPDYCVSRVGKQ